MQGSIYTVYIYKPVLTVLRQYGVNAAFYWFYPIYKGSASYESIFMALSDLWL